MLGWYREEEKEEVIQDLPLDILDVPKEVESRLKRIGYTPKYVILNGGYRQIYDDYLKDMGFHITYDKDLALDKMYLT